ncbi:MAG: ribosome assembly RNA-binding protein YhbY [Mariprofundaceae bacterium]|nr:ribosome assembly RNA-binding protein YhbY [Mariprofundaceae bacterium]
MDKQQKRALKKASHHLKPVVRIGQHGLSEGVINETKLSLNVHELIKVHIHDGQREDRIAMGEALAKACDAELVHQIGKNFVFFRKRDREG